MRQIKFRGADVENNEYVYGNLVYDAENKPFIVKYKSKHDFDFAHVKPDSVAQFTNCYDANGEEIYDGDEIRIDYEGAAQVIGEGMLLKQIEATKPTSDAKLKIKWEHYRYRLLWCTPNGRADTGIDMALLESILPYVEVA